MQFARAARVLIISLAVDGGAGGDGGGGDAPRRLA